MKRSLEKRWVVRAGDGARLGDILKKMGEDPARAIAEGRVFVGRRRATQSDVEVKVGDEVKVGAERRATSEADVASEEVPKILFDRDGLVACVKPAGIPTVPDHAGGAHSLVAKVARATGRRAADMIVTSRLDREVSGVVVFATSREAESRLKDARAQGLYRRRYLAIARADATTAGASSGSWTTPVQDKPSHTLWSTIARARIGDFVLLAVSPITGRTHQIRIHASHAGMPLFGDRDYGGLARVTLANGRVVSLSRIALHAARVTVPDALGRPIVAEAPVPPELARVWTELGGAHEAWDRAVSCVLEP